MSMSTGGGALAVADAKRSSGTYQLGAPRLLLEAAFLLFISAHLISSHLTSSHLTNDFIL